MRITTVSRVLSLAALTGMLCACASTNDNLQRATATEIGNTRTSDVAVSNVNRKATSVAWTAKAPAGCYECDADDMVRKVHCVKVDCPK
jgi:hypothetical protein